jgi:hypothetical protein
MSHYRTHRKQTFGGGDAATTPFNRKSKIAEKPPAETLRFAQGDSLRWASAARGISSLRLDDAGNVGLDGFTFFGGELGEVDRHAVRRFSAHDLGARIQRLLNRGQGKS